MLKKKKPKGIYHSIIIDISQFGRHWRKEIDARALCSWVFIVSLAQFRVPRKDAVNSILSQLWSEHVSGTVLVVIDWYRKTQSIVGSTIT